MTAKELEQQWAEQQQQLALQVIAEDVEEWQHSRSLRYVAGVDISFIKGDETRACAALTVCEIPKLNVVYKDVFLTTMTVQYIPGYLAFREAPPLISAIKRLEETEPQYCQVIMVDGNGILHPRRTGVASHIGVACNIPTIGVAKNLFHMEGLLYNAEHKEKIRGLKTKGEHFPLEDEKKKLLGIALKTSQEAIKPVYVSVGHKISLETTQWVVLQSCKYRIPEPIRQADMCSREYLRDIQLV